jgi:hypothetical protein
VSYGSAYHNGADCEFCGVRVMWDSMSTHRAWHEEWNGRHAGLQLKLQTTRMVILDLVEVIYQHDPENGNKVIQQLKELWDLQMYSEGVDSE